MRACHERRPASSQDVTRTTGSLRFVCPFAPRDLRRERLHTPTAAPGETSRPLRESPAHRLYGQRPWLDAIKLGVEEELDLIRGRLAFECLFLGDEDRQRRDLLRFVRRTWAVRFPVASLEEPKPARLDRKFDVLHVADSDAQASLRTAPELVEAVLASQACRGPRNRSCRPDTGDHVLTLCVDEKVAFDALARPSWRCAKQQLQ